MPAVERDIIDAALTSLAAAIWRQVARDLASPTPAVRDPAVAWLNTDLAVRWAYRFDPDIEPEIAIRLILVDVTRRRVRKARHEARQTG